MNYISTIQAEVKSSYTGIGKFRKGGRLDIEVLDDIITNFLNSIMPVLVKYNYKLIGFTKVEVIDAASNPLMPIYTYTPYTSFCASDFTTNLIKQLEDYHDCNSDELVLIFHYKVVPARKVSEENIAS